LTQVKGGFVEATDETQMGTDKDDLRRTAHLCFICGQRHSALLSTTFAGQAKFSLALPLDGFSGEPRTPSSTYIERFEDSPWIQVHKRLGLAIRHKFRLCNGMFRDIGAVVEFPSS